MRKDKNDVSLLLIGVGTHLTAMIAAGFLLGFGLDHLIDTKPVFMMLFGILGFIGGLIRACQLTARL